MPTNDKNMTSQPVPTIPKMVSPAQYASANAVSTMTVYRLLKRNEIPGATKIGSQWRIPTNVL